MSRMYSAEQRAKLSQLVSEGIQINQEIEDLSNGLADTIKATAEELEIKPSVLKRAIKTAQKGRLDEISKDHEELIDILTTCGRTS